METEVKNFKVPYTTILDINPHPDPETTRLEIATVYGFQIVVQKNKYKKGQAIIFIPIDSVLPEKLELILFPPDSKIKLHKSRVKQIRIRKFYSQGVIVDPNDLVGHYFLPLKDAVEVDLKECLDIAKYEPPVKFHSSMSGPKLRNKPFENPYFRKFNGISNIKWVPYAFKDEEVVIQEKLHGSHVRFGRAPFTPNTFWKKVKKFFGLAPKYECVYGSNNIELTNRNNYKGFYGEDVYGKCIDKLKLFDKIRDGEFVHAELIGPGVQKGYDYGLKEHHIVIFDVRVVQEDGTQRWFNPEEAEVFAKERGFDFVPVLYKGLFSKEVLAQHTSGPSIYFPKEIREGCVAKSRYKYDVEQSKQAFKSINPDYLNTDPSDNH